MDKIYSSAADLANLENETVSLAILLSGKKAMALVHETVSGKIHEIITEGNDHLAIRGTQLNRFLNGLHNFANYQNVKVAINGNYKIVPNKYFENDVKQNLIGLLGENAEQYSVDELDNVGAKIAYLQDQNVVNTIKTAFPEASFINAVTPFIDYTIKNKPGASFCLLSKIADELDIIVLKENKLQIVDRYDGNSKENILYYTLNVLQNINFDPRNTYTYLTGNLSVDGLAGKLMKRYGLRVIDFPVKGLDESVKNAQNYYKLLGMI